MKGCRCMIIALPLSGWGTTRLRSHHFFKSAKALLSLFVDASMISATQYRVVSSAYEEVSAERTDFGKSFVSRENMTGRKMRSLQVPSVVTHKALEKFS